MRFVSTVLGTIAVVSTTVSSQGIQSTSLPALNEPYIDQKYPYNGPVAPVGVFPSSVQNGNLTNLVVEVVEPPAVQPTSNATNSINTIQLAYTPTGMNIHYSTPFALQTVPHIMWGNNSSMSALTNNATGSTRTYKRTPACVPGRSQTMCNEWFYDVQIENLQPATTYYYYIPADTSGTTQSPVLSFKTAIAKGGSTPFNISVIADLGYTNAQGTYQQLLQSINTTNFVWHGGDISYADTWDNGFQPCSSEWPVCYNKTAAGYGQGYAPETGSYSHGGDAADQYETNWDVWTQWMNNVTMHKPYMVVPGNHEAACTEGDDSSYYLSSLLNYNETATPGIQQNLSYYACPTTQRNFTAYNNRFWTPAQPSANLSYNMWYSFDQGLVHFVNIDTETDFPGSGENSFQADLHANQTLSNLLANQTFADDSGPFGFTGNSSSAAGWQQYQWLEKDLASVNRTLQPWILVTGHKPMYSSTPASYNLPIRKAFEDLLLQYKVDAYFYGHIHWYERIFPVGNAVVEQSAIVNNHTYISGTGKSITHICNGAAGNIEFHSTVNTSLINHTLTAYLDQSNYGPSQVNVINSTHLLYQYIYDANGTVGDYVYLVKNTTV